VFRPQRPMDRRGASGPEDRQTGRQPRQAHPGSHPASAPPHLGDAGSPEGDVSGGRAEDPRPRSPDHDEGEQFDDATLSRPSPYLSEHVNRFGKYTLNLDRDSPTPDYALDSRPGLAPSLATASM